MTPQIGVILCSTRQPRVCPQIAEYVMQTIKSASTSANLKLIDLSEWNLPMFDEPTIPSQIKSAEDYVKPHTREWSLEIQSYSGFIFILPQYNWGYPSVIKNAIKYLFSEWHSKPAMIVSYGGHGGTKGAAQLNQVLHGVHMDVVETMPALTFPSRNELGLATKGELDVVGSGMWEDEKESIRGAARELMAMVERKM